MIVSFDAEKHLTKYNTFMIKKKNLLPTLINSGIVVNLRS